MSKDHESNHIANTKLQLNQIAIASKWNLQNNSSFIYQLKDSYRITYMILKAASNQLFTQDIK